MARPPPPELPPVLGAGWHFPVRRDDASGCLAMAFEEDSVRQSIEIILSTRKGERVMRPDFGCNLDQLLFAPNTGPTQAMAEFEVAQALKACEPRIEVLAIEVSAGGDRGQVLLIDIDYRVRSTDNRFNLVYPYYLDRSVT